MKVEYKTVWTKYTFNNEELRDIAETLAIKIQDKEAIEEQKKSVMSSFKEKIESVTTEINAAARKYKDRYEMKDIECFVERDFVNGEVRYVRTDNGEIAEKKKMTMADRQMHIDEAVTNDFLLSGEGELSDDEQLKISRAQFMDAGAA